MTNRSFNVLLVRHAQTDENVHGIVQGQRGTCLNAFGKRQSIILAERMARWQPRLDMLISSDSARAMETAECIAIKCGLHVHADAAWRERGYGQFEGMTKAERDAWRQQNGRSSPEDAEPLDVFRRRVLGAFLALGQRYSSAKSFVIITHQGPCRLLLQAMDRGIWVGDDCVLEAGSYIGNAQVLSFVRI